jgi:Ca2+-binding EF-hand superfamily protein
MSSWLASVVLFVAATATLVPAQDAGSKQEGSRGTRTGVQSYSESLSRDLFSACDADSDDRLDVFEASEALDAVAEPKDSAGFQRLDTDRDGFVSWPEFDQHFWTVVQRGGPFHVRPCRSLVEQARERQEARPASPLQSFLRLHDKNDNGGLDPDELEQMVRATNLPPTIGTQLRGLDHDRSGRVDEAELAPVWELLRPLVAGAGQGAGATTGVLPPPWQAGDLDGNGRIDTEELKAVLRRLDPALARWAQYLLRALDRDGDGGLGAGELPQPKRPVRHGTAAHRDASAPAATPNQTVSQASHDPALPASR